MSWRGGLVAVALVGATGAAAWWWSAEEVAPPRVRSEALRREDVRATVTSTGTVQAVTAVEVGTQVSGVVAALYADFNARVTEGAVIARIDDTLLQSDVAAASAALAVRQAELDRATVALRRATSLADAAAGTGAELDEARAALAVAEAQRQAAQVTLDRARRNVSYATIRAPVTGTVLERAVEVGQTVNAGMSAPKLFRIAGDLTRLQILVSVDEADIGRVAAGQPVQFTVQAYPDDRFEGVVEVVRMQAVEVDNVVTYGVVVGVTDPSQRLLPGMTANVELIVAESKGALCAPPAALRFKPDPSWLGGGAAALTPASGPPAGPGGASSGAPSGGRPPGGPPGGRPPSARGGPGPGSLWTVDEAGTWASLPVTLGLRGATCVEVSGDGLTEGLPVVTGVELPSAGGTGAPSAGRSPLGTPTAPGFRPGGF
jgi:HlyD family secretion protein